jgi:hypothetical protein
MTDDASLLVANGADRTWRALNDRGLGLALAGDWVAAGAAFEEALAAAPPFAEGPDAHALLLGNLAQAQFHQGARANAVRTARRSLTARLICGEEGDAPLARIRADLAVYLGAVGANTEAASLIVRAREAMEGRVGDTDMRLIPLLENEARLALLAERMADAEPTLLRLHALLEEQGADTAHLAPFFERVRQRLTPPTYEPVSVATRREPGAPLARSRPEPMETGPGATIVQDVGTTEAPAPARAPRRDDIFGAPALDDARDLLGPSAPRPIPLSEIAAGHDEPAPLPSASHHPLGLEIRYGIPRDLLLDDNAA